jgi:hypothetical protein
VYPPACRGMVVPSPAGRIVDLESDRAAEAFPRDTTRLCWRLSLHAHSNPRFRKLA